MPRIIVNVPETDESVTRPIVTEMINHVMKITDMPENTRVVFPGILGKTMQPGSSINPNDPDLTFAHTNKITIEVEEKYEEERLQAMAVHRPENFHLFRDDKLNVFIRPVYSPTDITINIKYRTVDRVSAMRWRDDIRTRIAMGRDLNVHELSYHYLVPEETLVLLKEIHRLREANHGYGDTFDTYLKNNASSRLTTVSNLSGTKTKLGMSETQIRIVGRFDFEAVPEEGERDGEGDAWSISFSYKFRYDKPICCTMMYPVIIHGQLLGLDYIPDPVYKLEDYKKKFALSANYFNTFEEVNTPRNITPGFPIPFHDDFVPKYVPEDSLRLFTTIVVIDPVYPSHLFNLRELGSVTLRSDILDFLVTEAPFMNRAYMSIFKISIYKEDELMNDTDVYVDSDLDVHVSFIVDPRKTYRVRLSLNTDLSYLDEETLKRIRKKATVLITLLETIDPTIRDSGNLPIIIGSSLANNPSNPGSGNGSNTDPNNPINNFITKTELDKAIEYINRGRISKGNKQGYQWNTVENLLVQAMPVENI